MGSFESWSDRVTLGTRGDFASWGLSFPSFLQDLPPGLSVRSRACHQGTVLGQATGLRPSEAIATFSSSPAPTRGALPPQRPSVCPSVRPSVHLLGHRMNAAWSRSSLRLSFLSGPIPF